jgi:hypothetical protein
MKALAILTVVAVLGVTGAALAERRWGGLRERDRHCGRGEGYNEGYRDGRRPLWDDEGWKEHRRGWMDRDDGFRKDAPEEIRSKMSELAKLRIDMRDALSRRPIDRGRASEVFEKMMTLRREIGSWAFNRRLDALEERQKRP